MIQPSGEPEILDFEEKEKLKSDRMTQACFKSI